MKILKVNEALYEKRPSNQVLAKAISDYAKKYPNKKVIPFKASQTFGIPMASINDYDTVLHHILNPVEVYGSGTRKSEFCKDFYQKMAMELSDNRDLIDDAFLDIWPKTRTTIYGEDGNYIVNINNVSEADAPQLMQRIITSTSKRMPDMCVMDTITYVLGQNIIKINSLLLSVSTLHLHLIFNK